jgi:catechol 2,3-dioxygenase-like lactoylglutathione lyase family enzyme
MVGLDDLDPDFTNCNHIGVVVKNADTTVRMFCDLLGASPGDIFDYSTTKDTVLIGEPFSLRIGVVKLGTVTFEFLQPVAGRSIWADFLQKSGEGLHHMAFTVSDWDNKLSYLKNSGATLLAGASVEQFDGKRWAYLDMKTVGSLVIEIMEDYGI